jgi:hypothetical protein
MAKILFLDDNPARHQLMDERYPGEEIFHASDIYTFQQMILGDDDWDEIWLDHDLNDYNAQSLLHDGTEATGVDACGFLVRMAIDTNTTKIIVHSSNGNGAAAMMKFLTEHNVEARWKMFDDSPDRITKLEADWEALEQLAELVDRCQREDYDYGAEASKWIATYGTDVVQKLRNSNLEGVSGQCSDCTQAAKDYGPVFMCVKHYQEIKQANAENYELDTEESEHG